MQDEERIKDSNTSDKNMNNAQPNEKQSLENTLQKRLLVLEEENKKLLQKEMLLQADLQNLRKRADKEKIDAHKYGIKKFLVDLLPVLDSISKGLEFRTGISDSKNIDTSSDLKNLEKQQEGLRIISDMIDKTMQKFGVEIIAPDKGEDFNPEFHDAVSTVPSEGEEKNIIGEVLRKGYKLNGRVLRAAMVIVAL